MNSSFQQLPLQALRILDLSRVLAGPWATQILADLGADVIKVEKPESGDETRRWLPPSLQSKDRTHEESAYFLSSNRGKRSIAIDFTHPQGQELIKELVKTSDVVVENFKKGTLQKYGLGYDDLKSINPSLIYCSITGFGQTGPLSHLPGFDYIIQAMGGLMSITGLPDEEAGGGPLRVGIPIADLMTGMYTTVAILTALFSRQFSPENEGQAIDMALFDVQLAMLANQGMNYLVSGIPPIRTGHHHPNIVPYQVFSTKDGPLVIAVGNDQQFRKLCEVLSLSKLADDPRFRSNKERVESRSILVPMLADRIKSFNRQSLIAQLEAKSIPCSPVNNIEEALNSPQSKARQIIQESEHPQFGRIKSIANPIRFSEVNLEVGAPPPMLGQHTRQILIEVLNLSESELEHLESQGVIASY